jgi:arsenate reductase
VPFEDPPRLARGADGDDALPIYRRVRDEIRRFVSGSLPRLL